LHRASIESGFTVRGASTAVKPHYPYNAAMPEISAGLIMFRRCEGRLEVLLVHPGGPFWKNKDEGAWSIPKGRVEASEDPLAAARREFQEETGVTPSGEFLPLGSIKQKSGKIVHAWAFEGDCDPSRITSNTMKMEFPPRSGKWITIPEVDRAEFFAFEQAKLKINPAQFALVEKLHERLGL
jgi:predicted NUDIX family NTP pyrophosphohydrolase